MATEEVAGFPLKQLVLAGADAPRVLVHHLVRSQGQKVAAEARVLRENEVYDVESHVDQLVKSQLLLARSEGAGAGAAATLAEMGTLVSGPAGVAALATTIVADVAALATIQVRLSIMIAAAYGHDMDDVDTRVREILSLHSLELAATKAAGPAAAKAGQRVGKRLLERYLRGPVLQTLTSMFRFVGVRFSRAALVRGLPLINIPANATLADITTRRTAAKARNYYRSLPTGFPPV